MSPRPKSIPVLADTYKCNKCSQELPVPLKVTDVVLCPSCFPQGLRSLERSHHAHPPEQVDVIRRALREEGVSL